MNAKRYDVLVVGGGHAGAEAALAAARLGASTALVTLRDENIARMSCNPSIGGIAKSHIVSELDALGGEMGRNSDYTSIQFRMLNTSKGPAVQALRAQCDKEVYPVRMRAVMDQVGTLERIEGLCASVNTDNGRTTGVTLEDGRIIGARSVVLTAGTFLRGVIFIGMKQVQAGRMGEPAAERLSQSLLDLGFRLERLKTGTPPRLHRESIDYDEMEREPGIEPPVFFSRCADRDWRMFHVEHKSPAALTSQMFHVEHIGPKIRPWPPGTDQIPCYLTHTTAETHQIIEENLAKSALYGGAIEGTGVRYCPSIEDKIVKFRGRSQHHVFVEPEGRTSVRIYPNGTSNSLPEEVQERMIHSIPGLGRAKFIRPGYGIEYDFADPTQLTHTLETKRVEHLYFAGQINGTTGYEEAAGQGFMAGVNAVLKLRGEAPFVLQRHEAYIGVLIDDLVTKGTDEPYRMFTSRAEYRLMLRQGNARYRMLPHAERLGLVGSDALQETRVYERCIAEELARLEGVHEDGVSSLRKLRRPGVHYGDLANGLDTLPLGAVEELEVRAKYEGYIRRERDRIAKAGKMESVRIPVDFDYDSIIALRFEAREKLKRIRPGSLGQASRISGVNPADVSILSVWLERGGE
jgi:tRNA uridine 5-carboxymethylaminomethyl modification enzyme